MSNKFSREKMRLLKPTTWYANPAVCARLIKTRRPRGGGKLFTEVLDDDEIFNAQKIIDTKIENEKNECNDEKFKEKTLVKKLDNLK